MPRDALTRIKHQFCHKRWIQCDVASQRINNNQAWRPKAAIEVSQISIKKLLRIQKHKKYPTNAKMQKKQNYLMCVAQFLLDLHY